MIRPELALGVGTGRGFGCRLGIGAQDGKVSKNEPHFPRIDIRRSQARQRVTGKFPAGGTLKVGELLMRTGAVAAPFGCPGLSCSSMWCTVSWAAPRVAMTSGTSRLRTMTTAR